MHIVFLNSLYAPLPNTGGAEATLRFLATQLAARGHRCTIVTLTPDRDATIGDIDGLAVHYLPLANIYWPFGGKRPKWQRPIFQALDAYNPFMRRRVQKLLATLKPDVMHAHNLQGFSVSAWMAARNLGIPIVQTLHDYYTACPRSAMWRPGSGNCATPCAECRVFAMPRRSLSHLPSIVTSVSHRLLARIEAAGVFAGANTRIIRGNNPAYVDVPPLAPPSATLRLGFIGRLDPVKGLEDLFAVLAELPPGRVSLQIAGSGAAEYEQSLRARVPESADIKFLGHTQPSAFFGRIDLLVVPSVWEEPLGRVFHEALQYGVPSLVMPLGGPVEVVTHGRTGFIAPQPGRDGLRAALNTILQTGWDRPAMRAACLQEAAHYAPDLIVSQYEAALRCAAEQAAA